MTSLARTLRLHDLIFLYVGGVIGSGIFLTPGLVLQQVNGSVGMALLVWVVGGVLTLLGSLTFAELAVCNPEAGGIYCYIRDGIGQTLAFLYGWCLLLVMTSGAIAGLSRAFSEYLSKIIPLSSMEMTLTSVAVIAAVTFVNVWGTRKSSNLQNWTTVVKVGIIITFGIALLMLGHHGRELPSTLAPTQSGFTLFSSLGLSMIAVLWAYEGWQYATFTAGEVLEPQKNYPRAFLVGALVITTIFLIMVVADLVTLGAPAATASGVAISANAGRAALGSWAEKLIAITVLISTFSAANSILLNAPRVFYAMAKDGLFFKKFAEVHSKFGTPAWAVVLLGIWSIVLACVGKFAELIGGVIFISWVFYALGAAAIFPLRKRFQVSAIQDRVPGYPWTPLLFILAAVSIVINALYDAFGTLEQSRHFYSFARNPIIISLIILLLGLPTYFFWRKRPA